MRDALTTAWRWFWLVPYIAATVLAAVFSVIAYGIYNVRGVEDDPLEDLLRRW